VIPTAGQLVQKTGCPGFSVASMALAASLQVFFTEEFFQLFSDPAMIFSVTKHDVIYCIGQKLTQELSVSRTRA